MSDNDIGFKKQNNNVNSNPFNDFAEDDVFNEYEDSKLNKKEQKRIENEKKSVRLNERHKDIVDENTNNFNNNNINEDVGFVSQKKEGKQKNKEKVVYSKEDIVLDKDYLKIKKIVSSIILFVLSLLISFLLVFIIGRVFELSININEMVDTFKNTLINDYSKIIFNMIPFVLLALSFVFTKKVGLINLALPGIFTFSGALTLLSVIEFSLPWYVGLIAGTIAGILSCLFIALFKIIFKVSEVITSLSFDFMAFVASQLIYSSFSNLSNGVSEDNSLLYLSNLDSSSTLGKILNNSYLNIGIVIMIILILISVILFNSKFAYKMKIISKNKDIASSIGINVKGIIMLAFIISGLMAGIAGAIMYLVPKSNLESLNNIFIGNNNNQTFILSSYGFGSIGIATLASSSIIGIIIYSFIFSFISIALTNIDFIINVVGAFYGLDLFGISDLILITTCLCSCFVSPLTNLLNKKKNPSIRKVSSEKPQKEKIKKEKKIRIKNEDDDQFINNEEDDIQFGGGSKDATV